MPASTAPAGSFDNTGAGTTAEQFEAQRPRLFGLAYRLLGSAMDAEDVVQDAYLRWQGADPSSIAAPRAWLAKVVTNLSLNRLASARAQRERYAGPWPTRTSCASPRGRRWGCHIWSPCPVLADDLSEGAPARYARTGVPALRKGPEPAMTAILVTGSTGTLGRALVPRLTEAGHEVRAFSRRPRPPSTPPQTWATGDLRANVGLDEALAGIEVVVHCASAQRGDQVAAQNLIAAARQAGAPHLVYISIAGVDRVPVGYYGAKVAVERLIEDSGLPWTILRATQFHELILRGCELLARLPVLLVPAATSFQPVSAGEVAGRLACLAGQPPAGRVPDMGGPQVRTSRDLAGRYLRASGRHRPVLPVWLPGRAFAGYRRGGHLAPGHPTGTVTFDEFLAARFASRRPR